MLGGSLGLAALSLLVLPRSIAYDPYSWLIWGREITHLSLDTTNAATAVKPLPIFIDALIAPSGSAAPVVWLLIARAATLLGVAIAFRLGRRLGGVVAGLVAAIGLAVSNEFLGYLLMQGMSEPMSAAAVLAAVDNHLEGRRRWALVCLVLAGLLRPEAWPFLAGYCIWLGYSASMWRRAVLAVIAVGTPLVWFITDWFGSRQFFRSAGAATHQSQGGPLLSKYPGLATLRETWHLVSAPFIVLFLLGLGSAIVSWLRAGRRTWPSATMWIGLGALAWLVVDAVLAQGRFATGAPRYLLPGVALAAVVAGVFVADLVRAVRSRWPDSSVGVAAAVLVLICLGLFLAPRLANTRRQIQAGAQLGRQSVQLSKSVKLAVGLAGGRNAVVRCGHTSTQAFQVPLVAWQLRIPVGTIDTYPSAPGTVLQWAGSPKIPAGLPYRLVGSVGPPDAHWTVITTCPPSQ
jgi:hypothetical protein